MKNKVGHLSWVILTISFISAACNGFVPPFTLDSNSSKLTSEPVWFISPSQSNIAIIVLDYQSLQITGAYVKKQHACTPSLPPISVDELKQNATGLFNAIGRDWPRHLVTGKDGERHEELAFDVRFSGDLAILEIQPDDLGAVAMMHRCTGLILFAASILREGIGEQFYPANPIIPNSLKRTEESTISPRSVEVLIGPLVEFADEKSGVHAWESVQNLNLVREIVSAPADVLVYLYPRTAGGFNPDRAEWVILINRYPTNP